MALCKEYLLIFDWDGVIVNSASYYMEVYRKICIKYNKDFSVKTLDDFKEWYDSEWENNFYNLGFSKEELPEILKYENKIVNYGEIDFFKNIKEILLKLSETFSMAIASTTISYKIRQKLVSENMEDLFILISGGEDGKSEKKTKIRKVIEELNFLPGKCIMVGDTVMDIVSSGVLGIKCIAMSCGWNSRIKLEKASPYLIVDSHKELLETLQTEGLWNL